MQYKRSIVAGVIAASLIGATVGVSYAIEKPKTAWLCGKKADGGPYVYKSGDEYIVAYPSNTYSVNSQLISTVDQKIPKRWKPENGKSIKVDASGFTYLTVYQYDGGSSSRSITSFDINRGLLSTKQVDSKEAPYSQKCMKLGWAAAVSETDGKLSGAPIKYLELRSRLVEFLNPKLGNNSFNTALAESMTDTKNGEYSVYKLLSSIDRKDLSSDQIDTIEQSKKKLLNSSSSETTIWESSGRFTYYPSRESEDAARERWNNRSTSLSNYTGDGYEIVSSNPDNKSMGYGLECQGTFYLLRKEGYID